MEKGRVGNLTARLQAIIDTAIDGIITIDSLGIVESINRSATELFGYKSEEIVGKNVSILMSKPEKIEHDQYIKNYLRTKKAKIIGIGREVTGRKKDGSLFPFRLAVSEVVLNDRIIFTGIIHDTTEIRNAHKDLENKVEQRTCELEETINLLKQSNIKLENHEVELTKSLKKERDLNEMKSRFVSMASHEFKTPLSTIFSSASLISKYHDIDTDAKRQIHVKRIKSAVNNLTGILNDFLSLSHLEDGKIKIVKTKFGIDQLLNSIQGELKFLQKNNKKIQILNELSSGEIYTDKRILKNLLFNLLSNGLKYSYENGVVICQIQLVDHELNITIKDQGIGIPKNDQKYLFQRFFRASNVNNIEGTGLGLHIVQGYVKLLEGRISFVSNPQYGTIFYVNLPINTL